MKQYSSHSFDNNDPDDHTINVGGIGDLQESSNLAQFPQMVIQNIPLYFNINFRRMMLALPHPNFEAKVCFKINKGAFTNYVSKFCQLMTTYLPLFTMVDIWTTTYLPLYLSTLTNFYPAFRDFWFQRVKCGDHAFRGLFLV